MLPSTWHHSLHRLLSQLKTETGELPKVAVVGVGNTFRSDDAAGILAARTLSARQGKSEDHLLIVEAGHAPENRTGELRRFGPDLVLFIDAAEMGEQPGAIRLISEEEIDGISASTHSLPLSMLARYLSLELNCKVKLLGIQLRSDEVGETVSAEVVQAVEETVTRLHECIRAQTSSALDTSKSLADTIRVRG